MSKIFSALRIGQLELSHRLVTPLRADPRLEIADYQRRATTGGLIIVEVSSERRGNKDWWKRVSDTIHEAGGVAVTVLTPASQQQRADGIEVDAAMDDIQSAARFARSVGFDGVELDAGDASLPDQFLQPETNSRNDDYGGDAERRMRFLLEASYVITEECSNERVGVRLSPCSKPDRIETFAEVMRAVSERELAYVHLSNVQAAPMDRLGGRPVSIAACADRRAFRSDISCALIASAYCDLRVAASAVESRWADAIGFHQTNEEAEFIEQLLRQSTGAQGRA